MGPDAAANVDNATIMQNTVTRWVRHELLDRVAAEHGLVVSAGEVDALIASSLSAGTRKDLEQAAAQQASVPPAELEQYAHDVLLERKLGAALARRHRRPAAGRDPGELCRRLPRRRGSP